MRYIIGCTTLLLAVGSSFAQSAGLSGDQIRKAFVGRTIVGTEDGESYSETLLADGSLVGRSAAEGEYEGEWSIDGNELCFSYEDEDDDCSRVALRGTKITFLGEDGANTSATLR